MAHDVFISYASENKTVADAVCATLESRNIRCWIAPRDILPGKPYPEAIEEAIAVARLMVIVFSQCAADSQDVRSEIHLAFRRELTIIPFRIQETNLAKGMNYWLGAVHWLDAMSPPMEKHLLTLAERVSEHLGSAGQSEVPKSDRSAHPEARLSHDRAVGHYKRQEYTPAIAELDRAIQVDPTVAWAFSDRGMAYYHRGEFELALRDLSHGLNLDPTPAWIWHGRACVYSKLNDKRSAIRDFTEAIRRDPGVAWFFHDRGVALFELGDLPRALEDLTQALLLNPDLEWAYRNRAKVYQRLGRHELAQADLDMAEKLSPPAG